MRVLVAFSLALLGAPVVKTIVRDIGIVASMVDACRTVYVVFPEAPAFTDLTVDPFLCDCLRRDSVSQHMEMNTRGRSSLAHVDGYLRIRIGPAELPVISVPKQTRLVKVVDLIVIVKGQSRIIGCRAEILIDEQRMMPSCNGQTVSFPLLLISEPRLRALQGDSLRAVFIFLHVDDLVADRAGKYSLFNLHETESPEKYFVYFCVFTIDNCVFLCIIIIVRRESDECKAKSHRSFGESGV